MADDVVTKVAKGLCWSDCRGHGAQANCEHSCMATPFGLEQGGHIRRAKAALSVLSDPSAISDEMANELTAALDWRRCAELGDMRSIKPAIAASLRVLTKE